MWRWSATTVTLAFQALAAGDIDAVFNDGPVSAEIITQNPEMGVVLVGEPATEELYGVAVQPDLPELLDAVNEGLQAIIDNGTDRDIFMEWFGTEPPEMFQPADMPSATYTSTITPTPEFLCVVVPRHTASVRSQPSTNARQIALARQRQQMGVLTQDLGNDNRQWFRVQLQTEDRVVTGWVQADLIVEIGDGCPVFRPDEKVLRSSGERRGAHRPTSERWTFSSGGSAAYIAYPRRCV